MRAVLVGLVLTGGCASTPASAFREEPTVARSDAATFESEAREMRAASGPPPFDRGEVVVALDEAQRRFTARCGKELPPSNAHAKVTFDPSTGIGAVELDSPTSEVAARCAEEAFAGVHIPPFRGGSVTVGKTIELGPARAKIEREEYESVEKAISLIDFGNCRTSNDQPSFPGRLTVVFTPDGAVASVSGAVDPSVRDCLTSKLRAEAHMRVVAKGIRVVEASYRLPLRHAPLPVVSISSIGPE